MLRQISKKTGVFHILMLGALVNTMAQSGKTYSLQECIEQALATNITVQQQNLMKESTQADYLQSRMAALPNLNASLSNSWQTGFAINPESNAAQNNQSFRTNSVGANSSVVLFNGFQTSNTIRLQQSNLKATSQDLETTKNNIMLNISNAYLNVLLNIELKNAAMARVEASKAQVERQKKMYELGSVNKSRYLQLKAQISAEELNLTNAQNSVTQAYLELWLLMNIQPNTENAIAPMKDLTALTDKMGAEALKPEQIFEEFTQKSPEIKAASYRIRSSELQRFVAMGGRSPRLSLSAGLNSFYTTQSLQPIGSPVLTNRTLGYWDNNGTLIPVFTAFPSYSGYETTPFKTQFDRNLGTNLSLNLSVPVFNGWSVNTNIQKARINHENAKLNDKQTRQTVFRNISQAHTSMLAARKRFESNEANYAANKEAFELAEKQFELGALNMADYLNTKNSFIRAEAEFTQARYELIFRRKVLDFYIGNPLY